MSSPSNAHAQRGVRHARITRSMIQRYSNGARLVLEGLRYALADGVPTLMTQAKIAEVANVSQGTVNTAMPELAEGGALILERVARTDVRGYRWQITMCAPPEVEEAGGWHGSSGRSVHDEPRSADDQGAPAVAQPSPTPQTPTIERSPADQHEDHDQYMEGEAPTALLAPDQIMLYNALLSEGIHSKQHVLEAVKNIPGATVADFRAQVAYAAERRKHAPMAFVISLWARGQQFRRPEAQPQPQPITTAPSARGGKDNAARRPARYAADDAAQREGRGLEVDHGPPPGLKLATLGAWYTGQTLDGR